ncbi:MAG: hypothetical protein ACI9HY_003913, partial [Planctomycetaceae bacterium]
ANAISSKKAYVSELTRLMGDPVIRGRFWEFG